MDEKTLKLMEQLKNNPAMIRSLMQSQDGQTLMRMLTQGDQGAGLQKAVQSAARGDTSQMANLMNQLMQTPSGNEVIQRINKALQK